MNYEVLTTPDFRTFFKKLFKKQHSLKTDLEKIIEKLQSNYEIGVPLGGNLYKVRMAIESKNKGTSGGARVIYYFLSEENEIYLVYIYDKSSTSTVSKAVLEQLLKNAGL